MTECPGYLGVKVTERSLRSSVELVHYDLLILCPVHFNLSVNVAYNQHHQHRQSVTSSVTSYDVTLTDAQQNSFHSFHTHVRYQLICCLLRYVKSNLSTTAVASIGLVHALSGLAARSQKWGTFNLWEVKVKVQGQNRCIVNLRIVVRDIPLNLALCQISGYRCQK